MLLKFILLYCEKHNIDPSTTKSMINKNLKEKIENISTKNPNIIWFDLSDSAGTTVFEIMPYVKKYAKNLMTKSPIMEKPWEK